MKEKIVISKTKKRINFILKLLCLIIIIVSICYFGLLKIARKRQSIISQENFYIIIEEESLKDISSIWLSSYLNQYTKFWVYKEQRIKEYHIKEIEEIDVNKKIVRAKFHIEKCSNKMNYFSDWYSIYEEKEFYSSKDIKCDMIMYFEIKQVDDQKRLYLKYTNKSTDSTLFDLKNNTK